MNSEFPQNERAKVEAKLTALLLGELHAEEVAALSKAMEVDPELAALYERLKVTIELVREGAMQPKAEAEARLKMSAEKREKLLASFKTVTPKEFAKPRPVVGSLAMVAAVVAILGILAAMMLPTVNRAKYNSISGESSEEGRYWGGRRAAQKQAADEKLAAAVPTVTTEVKESVARRAASVAPPAEQTLTVAPADYAPVTGAAETTPPAGATVASTPGFQTVLAPAETASASVKPTPIVLPPKEEPGQVVADGFNLNVAPIRYAEASDISGALNQLDQKQTHELAGTQAVGLGNFKPGAVAAITFALNKAGVAVTNRIISQNSWTIDTQNKVGALGDSDTSVTELNAQQLRQIAQGHTVQPVFTFDEAPGGSVSNGLPGAVTSQDRVPILADVPLVGRLFRSSSAAASNEYYTALTRDDLSRLRYLETNGEVASFTPTNADTPLMWGSVDGITNATVANNSRNFPKLTGGDAYSDGPTVNAGTLALGAATNSSAFVSRYAYVDTPAASDGLLTSGLRTPTHVAGVIQGEVGDGGIVLPAATVTSETGLALNDQKSVLMTGSVDHGKANEFGESTGFAGGGGFGGGGGAGGFGKRGNSEPVLTQGLRPASGGKQVELAAAADKTAPGRRAGGTVVASGDTTPTVEVIRKRVLREGVQEPQLAKAEKELEDKDARSAGEYVGYDGPGPFVPTIQTNNGGIPVAQLSLPLRRTNYVSVTNRWNVATTTRGFYDDNLNTTAATSNRITQYASAKEQLDNAKKWRQALEMRMNQVKTDVSLPRSTMVKVTDQATAASTEKPSLGQKIKGLFSGEVERSARIEVEQDRPDLAGIGTQGSLGRAYDPYFLQTEFEAIKSDEVLSRVVDALKLDGGDKSKTKAAEAKLKASLDVRSVRNTKFIEIGASSEKPEEAARIANAVAEAYRDYRSEEFENVNAGGIKSLREQLKDQDKKIQMAQAKVDELQKSLSGSGSAASASSASELLESAHLSRSLSLLVAKEAEHNQEVALLQKFKGMDKATLRKTLPLAYNDVQLNDLLAEYDVAQKALVKLKANNTPENPKYKSATESLTDLDRKIDAREAELIDKLEQTEKAAKASVEVLRNQYAAEKQAEIDLAAKMAQAVAHKDSALPKPTVPPPTPQPEVLTRENAFSTFSLNVSDVSFKLAAASLEKGQMPEPASIRSEEFINAFDYRDPEAAPGVPIAFAAERARYPFAHNRELLRFSLKTAAAGRQAGRPLNIVLLLDNSGSMERADRVSIIREALRVLAGQLQAADTFSIVTFARTAQLRVDGIPGNQAGAAADEIAKLTPEGGTDLGQALDLAYQIALHHYLANGDNRVVLLTDGAANLGDVDADVLKQKVEAHRKQGVALDCFGIGWEDYNDDLLEVLTRNGDGRYGFINKPEEADTTFVAQIAGALHVAAADVKVQVEFNPQRVTSYRQIGYAKHQLTKEQFRDNTVDAAEIAAQEAGNALYTIETNPEGSGSIATVRVRYKVPGTAEYREQAWDVPYTGTAVAMDQASPAMRLASTACAFAEWLATSPFASDVSPDELLKYMNGVPQVYGADTRPAKLEWMIRQAKSISGK